jgi:hypothetical protein
MRIAANFAKFIGYTYIFRKCSGDRHAGPQMADSTYARKLAVNLLLIQPASE